MLVISMLKKFDNDAIARFCCSASGIEAAEKKTTATTPITILTENTSRSVTRQLQSLVTVRELTSISIETRQTVGLAIGWIDIGGFARPVI